MNKLILIIVIIVIVIGGVMFVQSQQKSPATQQSTNTTQPTTSNAEPTTGTQGASMERSGQVKEFTVSAKNYSFTPNTMTVNKGDKVRITVTNTGGTHDLALDEFNVKTKMLNDGDSDTVEFTADKTGTFEFYCSVGNHRAMGMKGTLTVQ